MEDPMHHTYHKQRSNSISYRPTDVHSAPPDAVQQATSPTSGWLSGFFGTSPTTARAGLYPAPPSNAASSSSGDTSPKTPEDSPLGTKIRLPVDESTQESAPGLRAALHQRRSSWAPSSSDFDSKNVSGATAQQPSLLSAWLSHQSSSDVNTPSPSATATESAPLGGLFRRMSLGSAQAKPSTAWRANMPKSVPEQAVEEDTRSRSLKPQDIPASARRKPSPMSRRMLTGAYSEF